MMSDMRHVLVRLDEVPEQLNAFMSLSHINAKACRPIINTADYFWEYQKAMSHYSIDGISTELIAIKMSVLSNFYGPRLLNVSKYRQFHKTYKPRMKESVDDKRMFDIIDVCSASRWELKRNRFGRGFYIEDSHMEDDIISRIETNHLIVRNISQVMRFNGMYYAN